MVLTDIDMVSCFCELLKKSHNFTYEYKLGISLDIHLLHSYTNIYLFMCVY